MVTFFGIKVQLFVIYIKVPFKPHKTVANAGELVSGW